jgi:hypothetical protein
MQQASGTLVFVEAHTGLRMILTTQSVPLAKLCPAPA